MIGFLNGQTEYNYLENAIPLETYVQVVKDYGYDFISITDKNMHAYYKFYNLCIKNNIKPIIGLKIILESNLEVLVYARNDNGLKQLFKLTKIQEVNKTILLSELKDHISNLIVVTHNINYSELINELSDVSHDVYVGISNSTEILLCEQNNLKYLPLSKTSYVYKEDFIVYKTLKKIGGSKDVQYVEEYIKDKDELIKDLSVEAFKYIDCLQGIIYENINDKVELPIFDRKISDSRLFLEELSIVGLQKRLQINNKVKLSNEYLNRLKFELNVINQMGFNDYFLIVWDFIKFSKKNNILVGPGRGSAAGSLTAYCLGITDIDPLEYNLLFERFLNPNRVTLPDIDIDFPDCKREEVIQYVKNKYGDNHVCYISAFNTFGIKSSIRDICRVNDVNVDHVNLMLNHIDKYGLEDALEKYKTREELLEVLEIANKMSGLIRHTSTHAAGIILSNLNLDENIPLKTGLNDVYQSQLESSDLESKGFLKIDFLGIRNLTLIEKMTNLISTINLSKIPLDDKKTFELLSLGDTNGIFQLESSGIKNVLRKLKPSSFNDVVSVLALYRPGPMDNIDLFIERKQSKKIEYQTKELEPILKETYGIIVYQEQIMQIANVISNYSYAEADLLRRAVSKKDKKLLDENRKMFVSKALSNNKSESLANEIYDLIVKFADYGFNKSHSVAYARLSYEMAYLKANYTKEFIAVMLDNSIGDTKELVNYINYAKSKGIQVVTPKINYSNYDSYISNNKILLPFNSINKISGNIAKEIVDSRKDSKFKSFDDFKDRTSNFITQPILENLIYCGAFDEFKVSKKAMISKSEIDPIFQKYNSDTLIKDDEYLFDELKEKELISLGFNLNYDLFSNYDSILKTIKFNRNIEDIKENKTLTVVAQVLAIREIKTKNDDIMAFVDLDLNYTKISGVVFPKQYDLFINTDKSRLVLMNVVVQKRNEELQLVINDIKSI